MEGPHRVRYQRVDGSRTIRVNAGWCGIWLAWWQFGHPFIIRAGTGTELDRRFDAIRRDRTARRTRRLTARRQRGH